MVKDSEIEVKKRRGWTRALRTKQRHNPHAFLGSDKIPYEGEFEASVSHGSKRRRTTRNPEVPDGLLVENIERTKTSECIVGAMRFPRFLPRLWIAKVF
jgi:hypothetical protein